LVLKLREIKCFDLLKSYEDKCKLRRRIEKPMINGANKLNIKNYLMVYILLTKT